MARLPRLIIPGHIHHVTQRGNRRAQTFFEEGDYALYREKGKGKGYASFFLSLCAIFSHHTRQPLPTLRPTRQVKLLRHIFQRIQRLCMADLFGDSISIYPASRSRTFRTLLF